MPKRGWVSVGAMAGLMVGGMGAAAAPVFMLTSGNTALDQLYVQRLTAAGHTVTIGPAWYELNSSAGFPSGGVVLLTMNFNWANGSSMPTPGQAALLAYVIQGGGLVTTEWTMWRNGNGGTGAPLGALTPAFAVVPTGSRFRTTTSVTYSQIDVDPTVHAGMPASFSFAPDNFAGTESQLTARPGALEFYRSEGYGAGLVGWQFGNGRVANFSTCVGTQQLNDANFARLVGNVLSWAAASSGCVADFDDGSGTGTRDGAVTVDDLLYYLQVFADGVAAADVDDGTGTGTRDGGVTIEDLLYFLTRFESGC
jgi:hypothetical protein